MYRCNDCGAKFEDLGSYIETHGLDTPPYETFSCCPNCKGEDYTSLVECDFCFNPIEGRHIITSDDYNMCEECSNRWGAPDVY